MFLKFFLSLESGVLAGKRNAVDAERLIIPGIRFRLRELIKCFNGFQKSTPNIKLSLPCFDLIRGTRFQRPKLLCAPRLTCTLGLFGVSGGFLFLVLVSVDQSTESRIHKMRSKKLNPA